MFIILLTFLDGPSIVKVDVIKPSNLGNATPLALPLNTSGLTGVRIECTSPVIVKGVWLSLRRPTVTDKLCLSNLLMLGTTVYSTGMTGSSINEETNITEKRKEKDGEEKLDESSHPRLVV